MGRILIRRWGALGDVIGITPIVRHLKRLNQEARIDIETHVPGVFINHPHVKNVYREARTGDGYDQVVDLNFAYEKKPNLHFVDAYALETFGHADISKDLEIHRSEADEAKASSLLEKLDLLRRRFIVTHMARTWPSRTLPNRTWHEIVQRLTGLGHAVLQVGKGDDLFFNRLDGVSKIDEDINIPELACLISRASCFLGSDSAILHVAGTTDTPIVGIFTAARAELRLPYRHGKLGYRCAVVRPKIECYGCLHRQPPPVAFFNCERGDYMCLAQILPEDVADTVDRVCRNLGTSIRFDGRR